MRACYADLLVYRYMPVAVVFRSYSLRQFDPAAQRIYIPRPHLFGCEYTWLSNVVIFHQTSGCCILGRLISHLPTLARTFFVPRGFVQPLRDPTCENPKHRGQSFHRRMPQTYHVQRLRTFRLLYNPDPVLKSSVVHS